MISLLFSNLSGGERDCSGLSHSCHSGFSDTFPGKSEQTAACDIRESGGGEGREAEKGSVTAQPPSPVPFPSLGPINYKPVTCQTPGRSLCFPRLIWECQHTKPCQDPDSWLAFSLSLSLQLPVRLTVGCDVLGGFAWAQWQGFLIIIFRRRSGGQWWRWLPRYL